MSENKHSCEHIEPLLSAYVLGELEADARADVEAHVVACSACGEEQELLQRTAAALTASSPHLQGFTGDRRERILAAAAAPQGQPPRRRHAWMLYGLGGLAAAAAVVVVLLAPGQRGLTPVPGSAPVTAPAGPAPTETAARATPPADDTAWDAARFDTGRPLSEAAASLGIPETAAAAAGEAKGALLAQNGAANRPAQPTTGAELDLYLKREAEGVDRKTVEELGRTRRELLSEGLLTGVKNESEVIVAEEARKPTELETVARGETRTKFNLAFEEAAPQGQADPAEAPIEKKLAGLGGGGVRAQGVKASKAAASPAGAPQAGGAAAGGRRYAFREPQVDSLGAGLVAQGPAPDDNGLRFGSPARGRASRDKDAAAPTGGAGLPGAAEVAKPAPGATVAAPLAPAPTPTTRAAGDGEDKADRSRQLAQRGASAADARAPADGLAAPAAAAPAEKAPALGGVTTAPAPTYRQRIDDILARLDRLPGESPDNMFFRYWGDNPFVEAAADRLSTFGVDVDTASYTLLRGYLLQRNLIPPKQAVRTEEFINYFKGRYAPPASDGPAFSIAVEMAPSPFAHEAEYKLLRVGLKGREVPREKRKAANLVFVVDTSGSMARENRLELAKEGLRLLAKELDEGDTLAIAAFDAEARTILEPTPGNERERILDAIATLAPRRNTNVAAGLELGYRLAAGRFLKDGTNRVLLVSDGVANTGVVDPDAMLELVRGERGRGIYLTCVGVGMGNLNDALLERLADRGNGQCLYVDRIEEARKAFVDGLAGTLDTIARDVKIQIDFDPAKVLRYRLLGYENRDIADAAFRDNTVDAGEVGAGHEVTALYELKLRPGETPVESRLATLRVRYLTVEHGEAVEIEKPVTPAELRGAFADASPRFQAIACVAEFAEVLRDSFWARGSSLMKAAGMLEALLDKPEADGKGKLGDDQDLIEVVALMKRADALVRQRDAQVDEVARTVDAMKYNRYLSVRIEEEVRLRPDESRAQVEEIRRQNDDLRRRLEELLQR